MAETPVKKKAAAAGVAKPESFGRVFGEAGSAIGKASKAFFERRPDVPRTDDVVIADQPRPPSDATVETGLAEKKESDELSLIAKQNPGGNLNQAHTPAGLAEFQAAQSGAGGGTRQVTRTRSAAPASMFAAQNEARDMLGEHAAAQLTIRAANMDIVADFNQGLALQQQRLVMPLIQEANEILDSAERQLAGIQEMTDDVLANRINPGQFFANIGDAGVFAASMAVAAGHLAAALGGGPNTALSVINGAINRNMRAQALNQAHDRAVLNSEIQIFDRMRTLGIDRLNQANVYNALLLSQAEVTLQALSASSASADMRAQVGVMIAEIAIQKQQVLIDAAGSVTSVTQMKIASQFSKAQQAARGDVIQVAQEAFAQAMGGEAWQARREAGEFDVPGSEEEARSEAGVQAIQAALTRAGVTPTPQEFQDILTATNEAGEALFPGVESAQIGPAEEGTTVSIGQQGGGKRTFIPTAEYNAIPSKKARIDVAAAFRSGGELLQLWQQLSVLTVEGNLTGTTGRVMRLISRDKNGDFSIVDGAPPDAVKMHNLLQRIVTTTKMMMSAGKLEAMRGKGEVETWKLLQGLIPDDGAMLVAMFRGSNLTNRVLPTYEQATDAFQRQFTPFFHGLNGWQPPKIDEENVE